MIRIRSLTTRLSILFAALAAGLLVLAAILFGRMLEAHFHELDLQELEGKIPLIRNLLQDAAAVSAPAERIQALERVLAGHERIGVVLRDGEGRVLHAIHPEHFTAAQRAGAPLPAMDADWVIGERRHRGVEVAIVPAQIDALIGLDVSHHVHFLASVRKATWAGVAMAALAAALFGWLAAYRGLAPLRRVTETARRLSARQLSERLPVGDAPLEVRDHVDAFNGMLGRLEAAFQRLGDYSADIAHELRTPISNLMTQTQVALSQPRSADEYQDVLVSNLEECERIARMLGDMLFLAKADEHMRVRSSAEVDLALEADALIEFYEALAEERQIHIVREGEALVQGDALMLRRALSNLLSNALRHGRDGSRITIALSTDASGSRIVVGNVGEPIPADQVERVFERFHRGSAHLQSRGEGAGLGLAITRSIVRAHGGEISARSADEVTYFTIILPRQRQPAAS